MFFNTTIKGAYVDRRDFCVIASETLRQLSAFLGRRRVCFAQKIVIVLPDRVGSDVTGLEKLFHRTWRVGIIDILVVLSDSRCRVFSIVSSAGRAPCDVPKFALIHSWKRSPSCSFNDSGVTYFPHNKISSLHKCHLDVVARYNDFLHWRPLLRFLEVAINATFKINTTESIITKNGSIIYPPEIHVSDTHLSNRTAELNFMSPYIEVHELVYAVPRVLTVSVEWFRILNELSGYVWFALIVFLILSACTLYLLANDAKDPVYIILFTAQPLFGMTWNSHFLSWRGRVFFTTWLFFCVVLSSSYMTTFLSKLTVPSTVNAIESFDDLLKSGLRVHAIMHDKLAQYFEASPFFQPIINRTTFYLNGKPQKDRYDIAYLISKSRSHELGDMPHCLLPEIVDVIYTSPVRMTRYSPYGRFFEIAFMRAVASGALEVERKGDQEHRDGRTRRFQRGGRPEPISLRSFLVVFVVWAIGCGIAFSVFMLEYWSRILKDKTAAK